MVFPVERFSIYSACCPSTSWLMARISVFVRVFTSASVISGFGIVCPLLASPIGVSRRSQVSASGLANIHHNDICERACASVSPAIFPPFTWWPAVLLLGPPRPCSPMHIMSRSLKRFTPAYIQRRRTSSTPAITPGRELFPIQSSRASLVARQLEPPASAPQSQGCVFPHSQILKTKGM